MAGTEVVSTAGGGSTSFHCPSPEMGQVRSRQVARQEQLREVKEIRAHMRQVQRMREQVSRASRTLSDYGTRGYDVSRMRGTLPATAYSGGSGQDEVMSAFMDARQLVREIMRNEGFGQKSLNLFVNGICGNGIQPRFSIARHAQDLITRGKEVTLETIQPLIELYQRVMRRWYQWAESTLIDAENMLNLYAMQRMSYRQRGETGEFLIAIEPMTMTEFKRGGGRDVIPYKLRVIESDWLDIVMKQTPYDVKGVVGGRSVVAGVELAASGAPAGYWLRKSDPLRFGYVGGESYRIDASQIIFRFQKLRPGQQRGISPFVASVPTFFNFNDMVQAALETATSRSGVFAILEVDDGSDETDSGIGEARGWSNLDDIDGADLEAPGTTQEDSPFVGPTDLDPNGVPVDFGGNPVRSMQRGGMISRVRKGTVPHIVDPAPAGGTEAFWRLALRQIAAGPNINASQLSGDFAGKNYATSRIEQAPIDVSNEIDQDEDIACAWSRIWEIFVQGGITAASWGFDGYWTPQEVLSSDVNWIRPKKQDFDEERTANAQGMRLGMGQDTFAQMITRGGGDLIEHIAAMAYERRVANAYGVDLDQHVFAIVKNGATAMGSPTADATAPVQTGAQQ